jgi:hypothetical protein
MKLNITGRAEDMASQIIKLNINTATTDVYLPIDEIIFHAVYASG